MKLPKAPAPFLHTNVMEGDFIPFAEIHIDRGLLAGLLPQCAQQITLLVNGEVNLIAVFTAAVAGHRAAVQSHIGYMECLGGLVDVFAVGFQVHAFN